jgi:hypothetical protein
MDVFGFAYSMRLYRYVGILWKHMSKTLFQQKKPALVLFHLGGVSIISSR